MKTPPIHIELIDTRKKVHLVAFVYHERMDNYPEGESGFFIGFYIKPGKVEIEYYLLLVDETGHKQRRVFEAGDCIEYASIIATAMYPVTVLDITPYQAVCNETIFQGHLSTEMASYKKQLSVVEKRLEKIKRSYWNAKHENSANKHN